MKTKREVLEIIAKDKGCSLSCCDCPYSKYNTGIEDSCVARHLKAIGAMAILRQNRKKREFDPDKILTCVTADKAKIGMKGYFADTLEDIKFIFNADIPPRELLTIYSEENLYRFGDTFYQFALFYPIDEVEE